MSINDSKVPIVRPIPPRWDDNDGIPDWLGDLVMCLLGAVLAFDIVAIIVKALV